MDFLLLLINPLNIFIYQVLYYPVRGNNLNPGIFDLNSLRRLNRVSYSALPTKTIILHK